MSDKDPAETPGLLPDPDLIAEHLLLYGCAIYKIHRETTTAAKKLFGQSSDTSSQGDDQ